MTIPTDPQLALVETSNQVPADVCCLYRCDECGRQEERFVNNGLCRHCGGDIGRVDTRPRLLPGMHIPDTIYLQIEDGDEEATDTWTWCTDRISDTDIEYTRKE